jgi:hypothetical protein
MIKLDILGDEQLSDCLEQLLSGLLPHQQYDPTVFAQILQSTFTYVKLQEMSMEYHVLFSVLLQLNKMNVSMGTFVPKLTRDNFDSIVQTDIDGIVRKPEIEIRSWMVREGYPDNLEIETSLEMAKQKLYARCMELYDRCFERAINSLEALSVLPAYKSAFIASAAESTLKTQAEILQGSVRVGRSTYAGPMDWIEYVRVVQNEVTIRVSEEDENVLHLNSIEKSSKLISELNSLFEGIAKYGIGPLDDETPMLRHRMVVLAANENVGKTTVATNWIGTLLINNRKVVVMGGESAKSLLFAKLLPNYILQKYGKYVTTAHITGLSECPEEIQRLINMAILEIQESGNLIMVDSFSYQGFYDELKALYDVHKFDAVIIDHTLALTGKGNETENISAFSINARRFKKKYPVFMGILSHLSTIAKELLNKGKKVTSSPTRGSSTLSNEADEIFILLKNEMLEKQGLLGLQVYKRRAEAISDLIILKMIWAQSSYIYDPKYQQGFDSARISSEAALREIAEVYDDEEEEAWDEDEEFTMEQV